MAELIIALDCDIKRAKDIVNDLKGTVGFFKVGPVMFIKYGTEIIDFLKARDLKIFLDLKLHDIPNTVSEAVKNAADIGVYSISIHTSGGYDMIKGAVDAADERIKVWGISVLTSMNDDDLFKTGVKNKVREQVLTLAGIAESAKLDGLVASAMDLDYIRDEISGMKFITPSIRLSDVADDQKRFVTPRYAIEHGSDYLVVGRPVIKSEKPLDVVKKILEEMNGKK